MTNQLKLKSESLVDFLNRSGLLAKSAADQQITHKGLLDQDNLGKEQTQDLHEGVEGVLADTKAADNNSTDTVPDLPGVQDLNASGETGLAQRGSSVELQDADGNDSGTPAQEAKKMAADYRAAVATLISQKRQQAVAQQKQAAAQTPAQADEEVTGTSVMAKFAALTQNSTDADIQAAKDELVKLASTNPAFGIIKERILMLKMAEDIDALAEAEGISPDEAAAELQAAADANPEMAEELDDEATGEAVADLADAEAATGDLMGDIDQMAANASETLGVEVTPDDILAAADEVVAMAEEQGVEPEVLLQAAIEEMNGGEEDVSEEDMAAAEEILAQAADQGISPEEVIQALSEDIGSEGEEPAEAEAAPTEKVASVQQKQASTDRAAFVQFLRHQK